jgi:hypothetical protein
MTIFKLAGALETRPSMIMALVESHTTSVAGKLKQ